jgi:hypothetical protein
MILTTRKISNEMMNDGTVVIIIYLICVKRGVSADEDARTVVSDNGDTLSPKYAPEMIAPAIQPGSYPCAVPIPTNATPTVAIVVHELPVITAISALITHVANRNISGMITFIP